MIHPPPWRQSKGEGSKQPIALSMPETAAMAAGWLVQHNQRTGHGGESPIVAAHLERQSGAQYAGNAKRPGPYPQP